jgi:S1-C subfamily serine protease
MTEEEKEQTTGPAEAEDAAASQTDAGPVQVPGGVGEPIAMPAAGSDEPDACAATPTEPTPGQPDTPPMGVPQGTYAMGALAGNPNLDPPSAGPPPPPYGAYGPGPYGGYGAPYGAPYAGPYAGPYGDPHIPTWGVPPSTAQDREHRVRNAVLASCAAVAILAAGIGIGDAAWNNRTPSQSASGSFGGQLPNRSGQSPSNNGGPFGGFGNSGNSGNSGSGNSGSNNSGPTDADAIAAKADPALVDINTTLGYQQEHAAGTGIVLTSNGVVLTNNHVINGATSISVTDVGNQKTYTASVVGYDRTRDIAVLQLHNASGLQTAALANSSNVSVGQQVVGVGNAGGTGGTPSAAGGTVTALNQTITASDQGDGTSEQLSGLIETNANIQPGDSGGALVNTKGEVVGVDTAASAGYSFQFNGESGGNQGFAIPINTALSIAHQIQSGNGSSTVHIGATAFLGVEISPSGDSGNSGDGGFGGLFGGNSGNTGSSTSGAAVAGVVTNGPAQEAGLAQGDAITALGGKSIGSANDLTSAMLAHHPGDKVSISWTDGSGQSHSATVQLSSGPPQ